MIQGINDYEDFIRNLLKKVPLMYTEQLIIALKNTFNDVNDTLAASILLALQRRGYLLLSESGYVMTKGMYRKLTSDKFYDGITLNSDIRIPEEIYKFTTKKVAITNGFTKEKWAKDKRGTVDSFLDKNGKALLNCMWVIVDMLPSSENFILGNSPWNIVFDKEANEKSDGILYEVTYIPSNLMRVRCEALKQLPPIEDKEFRNQVRRIAIVDDESNIDLIPKIGFSHICKLNPELDTRYEVIKKIDQSEAWNYYE